MAKATDLEGADYGAVDRSVERSSPPRSRLVMALAFATAAATLASFVVLRGVGARPSGPHG